MRLTLRYYTLGAWLLVFLVQCWSAPANDDRPEIIEIIAPAQAAQETLDSLNLGEPNYLQSERKKRTIGVLREMFPELSKLIDQKVQEIAAYLVKTAGPTIISGLLGGGGLFGGGGAGMGGTDTSSGSVAGSFSEDDDDSDNEKESNDGSKISVSLPTIPNDNDDDNASVADKNGKLTDSDDNSVVSPRISDENEDKKVTDEVKGSNDQVSNNVQSIDYDDDGPISVNIPLGLSSQESATKSSQATATSLGNSNPEENQLDAAESQQQEVRVEFDEGVEGDTKVRQARKSDQLETAASENNEALDDLTLENADINEENRDKRLVSFGFGNGASSGGSGGGSGNFLFDIVRLVAGSGGTDQTEEAKDSTGNADTELKGDGYTEGCKAAKNCIV